MDEGLEGGFVEDGDVEGFGFVAFGAAAFAGEDVVGFGGDGAADCAAEVVDVGFHFVAVEGEGAGDDEGFTGERDGAFRDGVEGAGIGLLVFMGLNRALEPRVLL